MTTANGGLHLRGIARRRSGALRCGMAVSGGRPGDGQQQAAAPVASGRGGMTARRHEAAAAWRRVTVLIIAQRRCGGPRAAAASGCTWTKGTIQSGTCLIG